MTVETVQATLLAAGAVTAIAGTRVHQVQRIQSDTLPAVVLTQVSAVPQNHLYGVPTLDSVRVQVDCYAATRTQCRQLADATRAALEAAGLDMELEAESFEPDVSEFRITQDFLTWT